MKNWSATSLILSTCLCATLIGCRQLPAIAQSQIGPAAAQQAQMAPDFPATLEWLNTDHPLSIKDLRGKVVLLDFWTYCCINCMHIIPEMKLLEAKYAKELVVIGVHTAKFKNEKDSENIRSAILRYGVEHPVINDNQYQVWNAYGVQSWPTLMLIAPDGTLVGSVSGEGNYDTLDQAIAGLIAKFNGPNQLNLKPMHFALEKDNRPRSVLSYPGKLAADTSSNRLFISDSDHNRIVVCALNGTVQSVIGSGLIGLKDGDFSAAQFNRPQGVSYDHGSNTLYVADTENHAIRKVDLSGHQVTTLAGDGHQAKEYPPAPGRGPDIELSSPWDLTVLGKTLYVAMAGCHQLWSMDLGSLQMQPFAGDGRENILDGSASEAHLAQPSGISSDGRHLFFADSEVSAVRQVDTEAPRVKTLIGQGLFDFGDIDGRYPDARLQHPLGVAYHDGAVYVADTYNHKIKRVDPALRKVTTIIGNGVRGYADGPGAQAELNEPNGLVFVGDNLYITDTDNNVVRVFNTITRQMSTLHFQNTSLLAHKDMPAFMGTTITLPVQRIEAGAGTLAVNLKLPAGMQYNREAPFELTVTSSNPLAATVGSVTVTAPRDTLQVPISAGSGDSTLTVRLSVYYCKEGPGGLCFFKDLQILAPITVSPATGHSITADCSL